MPWQEYFGETHRLVRQTVRKFVDQEIRPFVPDWEEQGAFPRDLYQRAGAAGILGIGYPERFGGTAGDIFVKVAAIEEIARCGSGGVAAGLGSLDIGLPPILRLGSETLQERLVPPIVNGEKICALAITEPNAGSDVGGLQTRAVREGDHYRVNGRKTFITSGARADVLTCAVRTGEPGPHGVSLLAVETDRPGFAVTSILKKMGWWASDTAELVFEDCLVPVDNLLGEEGQGFYGIMANFQMERLQLALLANVTSELALEESMRYVKQREAFGRRLEGFQVIRHKLVDMATLLEASREFTYRVAAKMEAGLNPVKEIAMAKNFACQVSDKVTYDAVQLHGGYGTMREYLVERLYRDNRILSIGGGTQEIMKEIIGKLMF
jgi:acyl-CoA dehydrogenase